jgi:hypothetical protein
MLLSALLLLGLFAVLFIGWVAPRAKGGSEVFTMAMPLAMLGLVIVVLAGVIVFRHRIRPFLAEFTGLARPATGAPWQTWGPKNALLCPHCNIPVAPPSPEQLARVVAAMGHQEEPTVPYRCGACRGYWEARLALGGTMRQPTRTVCYDWRPLAQPPASGAAVVEAGPAIITPAATSPTTTPPMPRDALRKEAARILAHYQEEATAKLHQASGRAADPVAAHRLARQQAMRVLMQRHGLGPDEVASLFPD